uniref:ISPR1 n=1 Tax=Perkinsus marinus TaxID=31276 RepID=UPI003F778586
SFTPTCNKELTAHIDCVKSFLREARTKHTPYLPGTGAAAADKCSGSREYFAKCTMYAAATTSFRRTMSTEMPQPCEMELNLHGQCVGNYLTQSIRTGKAAAGAARGAAQSEDKCFLTRAAFEKCMMYQKITERATNEGQVEYADFSRRFGRQTQTTLGA